MKEFELNLFKISGKDKTLYELKEKHDAVLIATESKAREIDIPGHNLKNISAMDLTASVKKV